jgi:hypothetical protein
MVLVVGGQVEFFSSVTIGPCTEGWREADGSQETEGPGTTGRHGEGRHQAGQERKEKAELQKGVQRSAGRVTGSKGKILFERKELRRPGMGVCEVRLIYTRKRMEKGKVCEKGQSLR